MSLVIWVFSFLLLVVPLDMKYAFTMFGRSGVCVGCCFLSGWVYIASALLSQSMLSRAGWVRGKTFPFLSFCWFFGRSWWDLT